MTESFMCSRCKHSFPLKDQRSFEGELLCFHCYEETMCIDLYGDIDESDESDIEYILM